MCEVKRCSVNVVRPQGFRRSAMSQHMDAPLRALCLLPQPACWLGVQAQPYKEIAKLIRQRHTQGRGTSIQPQTNANASNMRLHMLRAGLVWWGSRGGFRGGSAGVPRGFRVGFRGFRGGSEGVPGVPRPGWRFRSKFGRMAVYCHHCGFARKFPGILHFMPT